jgi:hypothetical protein
MSSKRVFYLMVAGLVLLGGMAIAGMVIGNSTLKKQSDKLLALKLDSKVLEQQQVSLGQAKKDVEKYSSLEQIAKTIVPQEKDQARTVREIVNLANESGVPVSSITFPTSTLGTTAAKTTTTNTTSSSTAAKVTTPPITQVKPVEGISGLYQMEINVTSESTNPIPYDRLITFLTKLEQNRHTAQVTTISVHPSEKNRNLVSFSLTVNAYIKP